MPLALRPVAGLLAVNVIEPFSRGLSWYVTVPETGYRLPIPVVRAAGYQGERREHGEQPCRRIRRQKSVCIGTDHLAAGAATECAVGHQVEVCFMNLTDPSANVMFARRGACS